MAVAIQGMGTSVPEHPMSQEEAADLALRLCCRNEKQERLTKVLYRKCGVRERRTVVPHREAMKWLPELDGNVATEEGGGPTTNERTIFYEDHAAPLALEASRKALQESGTDPCEFTHLVTVSCTGFSTPGVDIHLINELGLKPTTQRVHVGFMGCHGAVNGLRVVQGLAADPKARVLLCATELCSVHYRFQWDPERMLGNALFADGSAALVCGGEARGIWSLRGTGSCLLPDSTDAMSWRIGNYGFEMMLSPRVPDLILEHLRPWMTEWLAGQGLRIEDVRSWAVHPGGPRILAASEAALGLTPDDTAFSHAVLADHGNMSSPTILFVLDRLRAADVEGPCVALGFGPGLVAEVALFDRK